MKIGAPVVASKFLEMMEPFCPMGRNKIVLPTSPKFERTLNMYIFWENYEIIFKLMCCGRVVT